MDKFIVRNKKRCHSPDDEKRQKMQKNVENTLPLALGLRGSNEPELSPQVCCNNNKDIYPTTSYSAEGREEEHELKSHKEQCRVEEITTHIKPLKALKWDKIKAENLDLDYCQFFDRTVSKTLYQLCEKELEYNTGRTAQIHIFGKWLDIPRKQVAFGDEGLSYTFSNNTVPARPWKPFLKHLCQCVSDAAGCKFNFVLINRYKDGTHYIGEHKDDEKDLDAKAPIASLSLGQARDFYFKHQDAKHKSRKVDLVKKLLEDGSLLLMNYPTNSYWYHSLPKRAKVHAVRINLTFRVMCLK